MTSAHPSAIADNKLTRIDPEIATFPAWLRELWQEKLRFNRQVLKLSNTKAREWATRTVKVLRRN
jgi:hypothetical protein